MSIRSFIAIEVPDGVKRALGRCQEKLRASEVKVRWVQTRIIHLTTKFLGDVSEQDVPAICEVLKEQAGRVSPFALEIATLGAFPPHGPPKVIWAGVRGDTDTLATLVQDVDDALAEVVGIQPEHRQWHPHLTLGRIKSTRNVDRLRKMLERNADVEFGSFTADAVTLFMSELSREGASHTPMATVSFEG